MMGRAAVSLAILALAVPSLAQEPLGPYEVVGNAIPKSLTGAPGVPLRPVPGASLPGRPVAEPAGRRCALVGG